jgi:hypothetical protein
MRLFPPVSCLFLLIAAGCNSGTASTTLPVPLSLSSNEGYRMAIGSEPDRDWQDLWNARLTSLETEFGKSEREIGTSCIPIYLGGGADVLTFKHHLEGVVYVTAGLIGDGGQVSTDLREYELMMCFQGENEWAPRLLSRLAPYTFECALQDGDTMDIAAAMPEDSTITGLLFVKYRQFKVGDAPAGTLLCIGITESELDHCRTFGPEAVLAELKSQGVYPYTDTQRESVVP